MFKNLISKRLRQARENSNPIITQEDLAARLQLLGICLDATMLSKIEQNKRRVYDVELVAIAQTLKVGVCWLLGLTDDRTK
ncbi:helix-turn-helix protein [Hydrogenoanaerobacterium saccharovorans]|uniref:Helix-turn-helix domain-containing protein n=1 Tax=Hydrogenoanaerobacterium saccharovorans TaxID=474960 RepID=A0A1H8DKS7_9FIRM|nr:helix-turn-helix transcriptional regulator [Hydrogenoanaerobacterium saccharovorans]RPF42229.1 helix-turn-helix protein [Hydrogenoanaerobacterium saccharovorans]SEN07138.1 Helix-turn-helix domain-containing protein [Hydrogenoanaerobacterium saccharovorans]